MPAAAPTGRCPAAVVADDNFKIGDGTRNAVSRRDIQHATGVACCGWRAARPERNGSLMLRKGRGVKFGLSYNTGIYGADPGTMAALAEHAEDCGFESFYVSEHIVLYPGARAGAMEFPPSLGVADP